jgi:hypothetical protein
MPETGSAEPEGVFSPVSSTPSTPTQKSSNASAKKADRVGQHDFANPTLNIINSASRRNSISGVSSPSREGTPPPLPPRPQLGFLSSRPSTSHSIRKSPSRPQLISKATTQLTLSNGQAFGSDSRDDSPASTASKQRSFAGGLPSRNTSDADDSASIRSYMPGAEEGIETESILGEVMGQQEKTTTEKALLRSLGHKFVDAEALSMFPSDPEFDAAFGREFDEVEDMSVDGSNEGLAYTASLEVACADVANRSCYAPMACETQAFPHLVECRKAHIQPTRRRPADYELYRRRADHHLLLPVHERCAQRLHCR